jgi:hypothetical protein
MADRFLTAEQIQARPRLAAPLLLLAGLLLGGLLPAAAQDAPVTLPAPDAMAVQPDPADFVGRADGVLMVAGNPHRFAGIGINWLGLVQAPGEAPRFPTDYEVHDILRTVDAMDSSVVRATSLGITAGCPACLVPAPGQVNADALHHMDTVLRRAKDAGVKLIIPLAGGAACPAQGDPDPVAATPCVFARFHHLDAPAFYTDATVRADFAAAVAKLLNHLNPLTGIAYKDDPTIMAWENCDACGKGLDPAMMADWTEFLGRAIKATDTHHLYENGAFAGRLGKQPGHVGDTLLALRSVDLIGDRVMPGADPAGTGIQDAADQVTRTNRVYLIDAYGWAPAQWATPDALDTFLKAVIKKREIAGAFVSALSGHADGGGYLPPGPASDAAASGPAFYFPGATTPAASMDAMSPRARAVRRLSFGMTDLRVLPFYNVGQPEIIAAVHGRVTWRGAAGATSYSIARSPNIALGGSWQIICDKCVTDAQASWQDPAPPATPVWYRMMPFNANDHGGMYSEPVKNQS